MASNDPAAEATPIPETPPDMQGAPHDIIYEITSALLKHDTRRAVELIGDLNRSRQPQLQEVLQAIRASDKPEMLQIAQDKLISALHTAAMAGTADDIRDIVKAGADKDAANAQGITAAHLAALTGKEKNIEELARLKADLGRPSTDKKITPLHIAVMGGHLFASRALIKNKVNVDARDHRGNTPLHYAYIMNNPLMQLQLINSNASVNAPNNDGVMPPQYTPQKGTKR
ncbi:MAG: ankyrin repeat domain-containing protein [Alphaproteobacteria bacterium]